MSNINELKIALANARDIAAKNIALADNINIHDMCESLEGMIDELEMIGGFQKVEDMEEKEFIVFQEWPATCYRKYRVKARTEEEAEMKVLEGEAQPFWEKQHDEWGEIQTDIKPYHQDEE